MCWLTLSQNEAPFALVDALNAEWEALNQDGWTAAEHRAQILRWSADDPALDRCQRPTDVLTAIRRCPDGVLATLILRYQNGSDKDGVTASDPRSHSPGAAHTDSSLAGRIVLQTMLGKLVSMARRDAQHAIEDYVSAFWAKLGSHCLANRPRRIAANLALDTLKEVSRDRSRVQLVPYGSDVERVASSEAFDESPTAVSARQVLRIACELGLIDQGTCQLLAGIYADGMSGRQAAVVFGLTPTTVRYRCSTAVRRLAAHAQTLAAA